jgi:hypothetical protein
MTPRVPITFFALAFDVSWGILALFVLFTAQAEAVFGKMGSNNPLFIVAVYAPAPANGPAWPDAQPWDSVIFTVLAAVIVVFHRAHCFDRNPGATDVLASAAKFRHLPEPRPGNA